jgi:hypothetical protein
MEQDLSKMPSRREQYAALTTWIAYLSQVLEASVVVFLRRGFGRRYFGGQAVAVFPLVLVYSVFWPRQDPRPLMGFLVAYLLACAWSRIDTIRRERRGEIQHSHYNGTPTVLLWRVFKGWLSERAAKAIVEPLAVAGIGILLLPYMEPLGFYLVIAAQGMLVSTGFARAYEQQRLMNARDAYLEQRHLAERFREGGWR